MSKTKSSPTTERIVVRFEGLEKLRESYGLNRKQMAAIIGVHPNNYTRLVRDPLMVNLQTMTGIINGFREKFGIEVQFDDILKKVPE